MRVLESITQLLAAAEGDDALTLIPVEQPPPVCHLQQLDFERDAVVGRWPRVALVCSEAAAMALAEDRRRSDHKRVESSSLSGVMHTGTPGIALGRACLWGTALWDEQCLEEIEAVVLAMVAQPQLPGDSLCYGNLGVMTVLELFAEAPWFPDTGLQNLCQKAAQRFRDLVLNRCDCQMHDETLLQFFPTSNEAIVLPGFFTGVSGIGLALLEGPHSRWMVASLLTAGLWPTRPTAQLPT
jgi:hypothetical protein